MEIKKGLKNNMKIIYFEDMFENISINLINLFFNIFEDLSSLDIKNKDCRDYLTYFIIEEFHNKIKEEKDVLFFINYNFMKLQLEIWDIIDKEKLSQYIFKTCKCLSKKLPFPIYMENSNIDKRKLENGEEKEFLNKVKSFYDNFYYKEISIKPLIKYCRDKGFIHLIRDYYSPSNSILLYRYNLKK